MHSDHHRYSEFFLPGLLQVREKVREIANSRVTLENCEKLLKFLAAVLFAIKNYTWKKNKTEEKRNAKLSLPSCVHKSLMCVCQTFLSHSFKYLNSQDFNSRYTRKEFIGEKIEKSL